MSMMMEQAFGNRPATLRAAVTGRGSRRWLFGSLVGLAWLVYAGSEAYGRFPGTGERALVTALLVLFALLFMFLPLVNLMVPQRCKLVLPGVLVVATFILFPFIGWNIDSLWTFGTVAAAMSGVRMRSLLLFVAVVAVASYFFELRAGADGDGAFTVPLVISSISLMMGAFGRQIAAIQQLRATQHELARLAVDQERSRVARDLHDILGHSLTVITVKAELAGRLVDSDPVRARHELSDLEDLARGALADVRSTAAGFRGVSIAAELANARSALEAAGIHATVPGTSDDVPMASRELFGWVVREGVTNVVRHSGARNATVRLAHDRVEVTDDGSGPPNGTTDGTGLVGLRERVAVSGARMIVGRSAEGGFRLMVTTASDALL